MSTITLEAGPHGTYLLRSSTGKSRLIQTDYDYPGIASNWGWSPQHRKRKSTLDFDPDTHTPCPGSVLTDGTIDCPVCKKSSTSFIAEAQEFLDDEAVDGGEVDDPGYFTE